MFAFRLRPHWSATPLAFALNVLWVFLAYMLCRLLFLLFNWDSFSAGLPQLEWEEVLQGALRFDLSAILYTNVLYALLMLLPWHGKERRVWQCVARFVWWGINSVALITNLSDIVYFRFTGRRSTMTMFAEFQHEGNIGKILWSNLWTHWYLLLIGTGLLWLLWRVYVQPPVQHIERKVWTKYYLLHTTLFLAFVPLCIGGMRGGFTTAVRPITISNATQYVNRPNEAALVLNTPFSLLRTTGKHAFVAPHYYTAQQLDALYTPLHQPNDTLRRKNVVVLIMESFGEEYSGRCNRFAKKNFSGYTPFLDSLMAHSTTWEHSFANGRKSIDGMPSVLSSIPMMVEPFFLTSASLNHLSGLAGELRKEGYATAFFHGAENGSMGFQAFARSTGFARYFGRTEYEADTRFGGAKDFDGTWAIWDEPFLQFYATQMSAMRQPFMTALFSASSHDPFHVPDSLRELYPEEGGHPIHKCVRYADHALRQFFATARRQAWYKNTIFVLTADHTSMSSMAGYQTPQGVFRVPIVFFDPSGDLKAGRRKGIAQQIDIMPTLLSYLGYRRPYIAFGQDLLRTATSDTYAVAYSNGLYLLTQGHYFLAFDGARTVSFYDYVADPFLTHNLVRPKTQASPEQMGMEKCIKAIVQSYMERMNANQLTLR